MSGDADGDAGDHRSSRSSRAGRAGRDLRIRNRDTLDGDGRKFGGVEHRRAQHVLQRPEFRIVRYFGGEVGAFFGARGGFIDHERGGRHVQPKCRRARGGREIDRAAKLAIDHHVVVPETCQWAASIHQNPQLGLRFIDMVNRTRSAHVPWATRVLPE